jgi:battenin
LWRWGVPLIVVYFAEYAMQSGTWSAIGFPVENEDARKSFYQNANWCYQVGVLISRSSGTVWRPKLVTLWAMPLMQVGILVLSTLNASEHWWWDNSLLASAVVVGLFGGAVYVNGFRMIGEEVKADVRELAIAGAAVSCDIGTNLGEAAGLWIQRWEEQRNGIN